MKTSFFLFALLVYSSCNLMAQDKFQSRKWTIGYGIGVQSGPVTGVPPSRNALNMYTAGNDPEIYNPDSYTDGLTFDFLIERTWKKNRLGIQLSAWERPDSYRGDQTDDAIINDSLKYSSLDNSQSYLTAGLCYSREIYRTGKGKGRTSIHLSFMSGVAFNLTPDRTEFDYYYPGGYLAVGIVSFSQDSMTRYLTGTNFKSGFFINPAIQFRFRVYKSHCLSFQMGYSVHWHKTEPIFAYDDFQASVPITESPLTATNKYLINAVQLKLYYSF
ncbi:MAG: hypothetical protein ACRC3B_02545 [Bacteroidia bacterium]